MTERQGEGEGERDRNRERDGSVAPVRSLNGFSENFSLKDVGRTDACGKTDIKCDSVV